MKKKIMLFFVIVTGLVGFGNVLADPDQDETIKKGQEHFKIFCINCHGVNADGKGPLVATLKITPSDLTALKQTGGDMCITERVLRAVAGVHDIAAGQEQKMPVFSGNLEGITIYEISQYLKSIQK
jgi:mono/diheme cytochrome c family protein